MPSKFEPLLDKMADALAARFKGISMMDWEDWREAAHVALEMDDDGATAEELPSCFWARCYICPNDECRYIGSAEPQFRTGYCWSCTHPLTDDDIVKVREK